ncbi:MAG: hypothetical protein Kow0042_03620 [Calditrichia bacterium]
MNKIQSVQDYINRHENWSEALQLLHETICTTELQDSIKWGAPVYTYNGKNMVGLGAFKSYVAVWFFQGALLTDPQNKLVNAQENKTKALRQWRFTSAEEIAENRETILTYIKEAISNSRRGKEIKPERNKPFQIPEEFQKWLDQKVELKRQFDLLSKSKQREYAKYIAEAKRFQTKEKRMEKIEPMILAGVGLYDKYKK